MERNVYSLVLFDEVVDAVDRLAYERSTSRSALINRILAEYLSCPLPETRIQNIFDWMEQAFSDVANFQVHPQPSDTMISIRSALRYRYNPSVRYVLELFRQSETEIGELRVVLRSQNQSLIRMLTNFFAMWNSMENLRVGRLFPNETVPAEIGAGRYTRRLRMPQEAKNRESDKIAAAIFDYITELDKAMKAYFSESYGSPESRAELGKGYQNYVKNSLVL